MRYKVVKRVSRIGNAICVRYLVKEEVSFLGIFKVWRYCREEYKDYDDWRADTLKFGTEEDAEAFIKKVMRERKSADDVELGDFDIKIYECRDSKLDQLV